MSLKAVARRHIDAGQTEYVALDLSQIYASKTTMPRTGRGKGICDGSSTVRYGTVLPKRAD